MQKNKIEVSKGRDGGQGVTMFVPLSVYRAGRTGLTISYPGTTLGEAFRFGTTPAQLDKFKDKLHELFSKYVPER